LSSLFLLNPALDLVSLFYGDLPPLSLSPLGVFGSLPLLLGVFPSRDLGVLPPGDFGVLSPLLLLLERSSFLLIPLVPFLEPFFVPFLDFGVLLEGDLPFDEGVLPSLVGVFPLDLGVFLDESLDLGVAPPIDYADFIPYEFYLFNSLVLDNSLSSGGSSPGLISETFICLSNLLTESRSST